MADTHFQKTIFVANPGSHQLPLRTRFSTARPAAVIHPAGGGLPGPVPSGTHDRVFATGHQPGQAVSRGGSPVRKPKIHPPHPQSRLARGPGG